MTNPTSNFGWQMPTPTDLVTDLPADFEVFGQAVDTSMADLKGGTTGQILSKATNADMDFTWITNDVGDITAVNVTSPITGGGSAGAVTIGINAATTSVVGAVQLSDSTSTTSSVLASTPTATKAAYDLANTANTTANAATPKSTFTAKGSIAAATAASTPANLAVGANDLLLTADSTQATGLKYSGAWTSYTPTYTNFSLGNGTVSSNYCQIGKVMFYAGKVILGSTSTVTGNIVVSLPKNSVRADTFNVCYYLEAGVAYIQGNIFQATGSLQFGVMNVAVAYPSLTNTSPTVPFTWGTGDEFSWLVSYEVA
jgi:hypothetical protein